MKQRQFALNERFDLCATERREHPRRIPCNQIGLYIVMSLTPISDLSSPVANRKYNLSSSIFPAFCTFDHEVNKFWYLSRHNSILVMSSYRLPKDTWTRPTTETKRAHFNNVKKSFKI